MIADYPQITGNPRRGWTKQTHTPGPWIAKPTASLGPQYAVYPEASGPDIAIVYDHGNTEANARLIASAPELLAALEAILAVNPDLAEVADTARAALEKAKGK